MVYGSCLRVMNHEALKGDQLMTSQINYRSLNHLLFNELLNADENINKFITMR